MVSGGAVIGHGEHQDRQGERGRRGESDNEGRADGEWLGFYHGLHGLDFLPKGEITKIPRGRWSYARWHAGSETIHCYSASA